MPPVVFEMLEPLPAVYEMLLRAFAWIFGSMACLLVVAYVVVILVELSTAGRHAAHRGRHAGAVR